MSFVVSDGNEGQQEPTSGVYCLSVCQTHLITHLILDRASDIVSSVIFDARPLWNILMCALA